MSGEKTVKLAKAAQTVARKLKVEIVVAPPQPALATVAKKVRMPVICQHVDDEKVGSSTGYFVPEIAKSYGAVGSLINHSEHRIEMKIIANLVERLRKLGMTSIVCAESHGRSWRYRLSCQISSLSSRKSSSGQAGRYRRKTLL